MTHSPSPAPNSTTATRSSSPPAPTGDHQLQIDPVPAITFTQSSPYPFSHPTPSMMTTVMPSVMNQYQKIFSHDALRPAHQDRKSTRLNSSHVAISYAVFCLKKKKHTN